MSGSCADTERSPEQRRDRVRASRSSDLLAEHAELERRAGRPGGARRPGPRPQARPPLRRARPGRRDRPRAGGAPAATSRPPASSPREDASFAAEADGARGAARRARPTELRELLLPRDPDDDKDVILEIKAGEGGEESALFAGDLLRMYLRYAERQGWKTEVLDATESDLGGYKDVTRRGQGRAGRRAGAVVAG